MHELFFLPFRFDNYVSLEVVENARGSLNLYFLLVVLVCLLYPRGLVTQVRLGVAVDPLLFENTEANCANRDHNQCENDQRQKHQKVPFQSIV